MLFLTSRYVAGQAEALKSLGMRAPLRLSTHEVGEVLDADGRKIITVDVDGEMPDDTADRIAAFVVTAVNTVTGTLRAAETAPATEIT